MKSLLYYLLQVIVASGILYGYYHLALRNKKFHRYNRFYLLAATVISITIPFLNIPVYFSQSETDSSFVLQTLTVISSGGGEVPTITVAPETHINWFSWETLSFLFYILIASLVLSRIIFSLVKIRRIIKTNPVEQLDKIRFVNTNEPGTPFSFFRWLFWNKKIELQSEKGEQIFRHELFHIKQKHSWDIMYLELLTVLLWINPFFHLIKKEVKAIHEFLADQFAITENRKWEYAELLLMQVLNTKQQLVNPFFHNQIKRRIAMITTSKKPSYQYLRKMMVLPVAAIVMGLFAFSYKEKIKIEGNNSLFISELANLKDTIKKPSSHKIIWMEDFPLPSKKSPVSEQLKVWADPKIYGVWLDNKRISNSELARYKSSDFALYNVSKLSKNTVNYGKHFYQVDLVTNKYYDNSQDYKNLNTKKYYILKDTTKPLLGNRFEKSLIVIDGEIQEGLNVYDIDKQFSSNNIESINVLKGPSAISKYSDKGKNGVIEIITKKSADNQNIKITLEENKQGKADNKIFTSVEIEPSFPGGEEAFIRYITYNQKKHKIPIKDSNLAKSIQNVTSSVEVKFLVDTDGTVSDVTTSSTDVVGLGKDAVELIKKGPKWIPASQNGHQIKAYKYQIVKFVTEIVSDKLPTEPKWQKAGNGTPQLPEISLDKLRKATPLQLLQLPEGTEIVSYKFTIDLDDDSIVEVPNTGNSFSPATKNQFNKATAGRMITFDRITIMENGQEKKIPSKVYAVTN